MTHEPALHIDLYLDEDVDVLVAELIRVYGFDAVTSRDAGQLEASDDVEQIAEDPMPYFDDDGTELNPDHVPKPSLCVACANDDADDEMMRILCTMTRLDQQDEDTFTCHAYVPQSSPAIE